MLHYYLKNDVPLSIENANDCNTAKVVLPVTINLMGMLYKSKVCLRTIANNAN